jgi:hypothetical protein
MFSEILKPVNAISLFLGLVGVIWGVYTYYDTKQYSSISYAKVSRVVFADSSGKFKLLAAGKELELKKDLSLTRIIFWNSGTLPINPADLRRPLQVLASSGTRFFDAAISHKFPDHAGFSIKRFEADVLELDWKFFDPKFSFILELYHEGSATDALANMSYISDVNVLHEIPTQLPPWFGVIFFLYGFFVTGFFFFSMRYILSMKIFDRVRGEKDRGWAVVISMLFAMVLGLGSIWIWGEQFVDMGRLATGMRLHDVAKAEIAQFKK